MTEPGDDDLIRAVQRQDAAALMTLYDRYNRVAFALAYRVLDDAATAEEVVQDAFMLVWKRADSFDLDRGGSLRAWLLTIVRHRTIDFRRRYARQEVGNLPLDAMEAVLAGPDVWENVLGGLDRDQIRAAVAALPDEQRRAIELAYFDGLTHGAIAEQTGAPLGTVKGRLRLGLQKLHASLLAMKAP